jgi:hypothetical protein
VRANSLQQSVSGHSCESPFVSRFGLVHLAFKPAMDDEFGLVRSRVLNAYCIRHALDHFNQLRDRPPQFVAIAEFIGGSTCERHNSSIIEVRSRRSSCVFRHPQMFMSGSASPAEERSQAVLALLLLATKDRGHRSGVHDSKILIAVVEDRIRALDALFL